MAENITFEYEGATFTVKPGTIGSGIRRDHLLLTLDGVSEPVARWLYARAVSQTAIEGEVDGWQAPEPGADEAAIRENFLAWLELPAALGERWVGVVEQINRPTAAPEHQPEVSPDADPE